MVEEQQVVEAKQVDCLALFEPIQAQMAQAKIENDKLTFEYETPAGERAARSHIQKLRHVKTEIANVHKMAKSEALAICRKIDGFKNKLTGEVDELIAVHNGPIQQIQKKREDAEAEELRKIQEAKEKAEAEHLASLERREALLKAAEEKVARQEAERLAEENAKKAETERFEQERRIRAEATVHAEAKAMAEAEAKESAERQRREAENRRLVAEQETERKRQANKKHRAKIENEIYGWLTGTSLSGGFKMPDVHAKIVLTALKDGTIPHVRIEY